MCQQRPFLKVTSAAVTGGTLVLSTDITTAKTYSNGERIAFCICTTLPASTTISPVELEINGTNIPMLDVFGNTLQSDQIKSRHMYVGVWGALGTGHIRLCTCTGRSQAAHSSTTIESEVTP